MTWQSGGPVTAHKHDVGAGWHPLLDQMHEELVLLDPNYQVVQVKEKFGGLRVYLSIDPDTWADVRKVVSKYEALSYETCEVCGQPGKSSDPRKGWIKTECPEHAADRPARIAAFWKQRADDTRDDIPTVEES